MAFTKMRLTNMPRLTLNGDEECEDEERGEDAGGEDFVRERHLFNSIYSCEKGKDEVMLYFISICIEHKDIFNLVMNWLICERKLNRIG